MVTCNDCIHRCVCPIADGCEYADEQHIRDDCEYFAPTADVVPKSEVEKLELTLQGVMWSVDKWLDETDYDAAPIKRAIAMREKTLKIVENAKADVAREIFEELQAKAPWFCENQTAYEHFNEELAELKKKYTEGET